MSKVTKTDKSKTTAFESVDIDAIELSDSLIQRRRAVNAEVSLMHQYHECERTGRIDNFRIASGRKQGSCCGRLASDSDVYKWIEAVAYTLCSGERNDLKELADDVIELIKKSQDSSGYLNTSYQIGAEDKKWSDLLNGHELYCGAHLIQAALAYYRCTGDEELLDVAVRWADCVCDLFGSEGRDGTGGHPQVEMALVELFRETQKSSYLQTAVFFMEQRGMGVLDGSENRQDHLPVRKQKTATGHAVRQLYLASGTTDIYAETGDSELFAVLKKQWLNFTEKRMAITGGAGSRYSGEAFGLDYEIPNRNGYYETCAAIASFMWNWRMLQVTGEAKYADIMEKALYNGILSGVSLEGREYFYTNPLEHRGRESVGFSWRGNEHMGSNTRTSRHWDRTACCPPNMARLLASLPGYLYGIDERGVYIHHFLENKITLDLCGTRIRIVQETGYPWEGTIKIRLQPEKELDFSLKIRIPGWAAHAMVSVNGKEVKETTRAGTYLTLKKRWTAGDEILLNFPMSVEKTTSHPCVTNNCGCAALQRGPVVYCIESVDFPNADIYKLILPHKCSLDTEYRDDLLGGVVLLKGTAKLKKNVSSSLYRPSWSGEEEQKVDMTAIPYFAWANRKPGAMRVWLPLS